MTKKLICLECPKGCVLLVKFENERVVSVSGNNCPKGEKYAQLEVESPVRILTSTILARGLALKMVPVRTDAPIGKKFIFDAMKEIKEIRITEPVACGDVLVGNFMGQPVDLIATRSVACQEK